MEALILIIFTLLAVQGESEKFVDGASREECSSSSSNLTERFEIIKPPKDGRTYRGLRLKNDLKVLLVSDSLAEKSAACMVVGVGGLNDFPDVPGLTNLVGYLLLRSSKNYPISYEFDRFLSAHGGSVGLPVTRAQDQEFSFDVNPSLLAEALRRFSDFFVEPMIYRASTKMLEETIKFVPKEQSRRTLIEKFRIAEVENEMTIQKAVFCLHLVKGTVRTLYQHTKNFPKELGENEKRASLFEKVRTFHSLWYSSNIMTLAVLGKESLDRLEKMVVPLFEKIENKHRKKMMFSYENHPWGPEQLKFKIYIFPADNSQLLRLNFPVPDVTDKYRTSPDVYVGNLIAEGGAGSLYPVLEEMDLCRSLQYLYIHMNGISFFVIQAELTDKGVDSVDEIIHLVFQYIHILRKKGVQEWIFEGYKKLYEKAFSNYEPDYDESLSYVEKLAHSMQTYPVKEILSYNYAFDEWNPLLIKDFLKYLRPDNMNVSIVSKSSLRSAPKLEKYYATPYGIEKISDEFIKKWSTEESSYELQFPLSNEFLTENFELYPVEENVQNDPYLLHKSAISEIWFKQDDRFRVPKLYVTLNLHSAIIGLDPRQIVLFHLFYNLLSFSLADYLNNATLTGFNWTINLEGDRIRIRVDGYNDKLPLLLEKLLSKIINFKNNLNDEKNFQNLLDELVEYHRALFTAERMFEQLDWYTQNCEAPTSWTINTTINAGKTLQYHDLKKFVSKFFRRIFMQVFIHGNCTRQIAIGIANIIENVFQSSDGLLLQETLPPRAVEIAEGSQIVVHVFNEKCDVYAYSSHFQFYTELYDMKNDFAGVLIYYAIWELCQEILSGQSQKQKLEIRCAISKVNGVQGLTISAVATKEFRKIHKKLEQFLHDALNFLRNLSDDKLKEIKTEAAFAALKEPSDLNELSELYWLEIANRRYNFDAYRADIKRLHSMKRADLVAYFKEMLIDDSTPRRRHLSVHVFPRGAMKTRPATGVSISAEAVKFENFADLISASNLLPYKFRVASLILEENTSTELHS